MKTTILFLATLGLAGAIAAPTYAQDRAKEEAPRAQYHFRQEDAPKLRKNYKNISKVDVHNRGRFVAGEVMPGDWHHRIHPVPQALVAELPPPPPGYLFGYIDGYCVAYDPNTGYIADVVDLTAIP
jgi:Ni/Co efflux regulator RcnB